MEDVCSSLASPLRRAKLESSYGKGQNMPLSRHPYVRMYVYMYIIWWLSHLNDINNVYFHTYFISHPCMLTGAENSIGIILPVRHSQVCLPVDKNIRNLCFLFSSVNNQCQ